MKKMIFWQRWNPDYLITILRVALGFIFVIGGIKIAFPPDPEALAASYIDPSKGWISPFFGENITGNLGISISSFLKIQGLIEIFLGIVLILGIFTSIVAIVMGLMFWSFTVANPIVGEVRLSRDIALMGLCFALALIGDGALSIDRRFLGIQSKFFERRDPFLLIIRMSLAYTLIDSALFSGGVFDNHLNTSLPVVVVLLMGFLIAVGIFPRRVMVLIFVWMLYLILMNLIVKGIFPGLDSVKREIGFLAASFVYFMLGPDRWAWPKPR